jgi:hypothetical protein
VLAKCKNPPQPFSIPGAGQGANANAAAPDPVLPLTAAIPGVLAPGQSWKVVLSWEGRNVDGPIAGDPRPFGNTGIIIGIAIDPAGNRLELIRGHNSPLAAAFDSMVAESGACQTLHSLVYALAGCPTCYSFDAKRS